MVSSNVKKLLQDANALSEGERQELCRLLEAQSGNRASATKRGQLRQVLVERGLLDKDSPRPKDPDRYSRWRPITLEGEPLSRTLIEERR